jgi:DNA-binding beta-propeller fold protein YncE/predicted flap endonuclease-1-like 5' DNA nuclease
MKLRDSYDGSGIPFQGDRMTLLKSIPVNARIERATVSVTPVDATRGAEPFAETTAFDGATGTWGATKTVVPGGGGWVEVDFHARRTLASVSGSNLSGTSLQVDFGGVFVELNPAGSVRTPNDSAPFRISSEAQRLPGLTVTKIKFTNASDKFSTPDVRQVTFRSLASNVTLRLGDSAPFWARVGELVTRETTPDFAPLLQAFLAQAKTENGFFLVPLTLHTDTLARLNVSLEIDHLVEQNVLPPGLSEITLPFNLSTRANAPPEVLQIVVPHGSRVARRGASARVNGVFEPTRLVRETDVSVAPAGSVEVTPALSHAQPVKLTSEAVVSDIDLLFTVNRTARFQLDIREDFDGKPGETSFLAAPVAQTLPAPVGVAAERRAEGETKWLSVRLPNEFQFKAGTTYWLVLQSLEGTFEWQVAPAPAGSDLTLQRTDTGGLSWRGETATPAGDPVRAFFRLRRRPDTFEVPIELEIGEGEQAVRLNMDRFQPLGRVDFELDPDDLSNAINEYIDKEARAGSCTGVEHLDNGDFEQWLRVGDALGQASSIPLNLPPRSLAFAPDGSWAYVGLSTEDDESGSLGVVDVACGALVEPAITLDNLMPDILVLSPTGTRAYVTDGRRFQIIDATTHRALAPSVELPRGSLMVALAVSPDGARLYAAMKNISFDDANPNTPRHQIVAIETERLEQLAARGGRDEEDDDPAFKTLPLSTPPISLAVSPDGNRLYVVTFERNTLTRKGGQGELHILDALTLQPPGDIIIVGNQPEGIALSADGKRAVVLNVGDFNLSVIDTTMRRTVATISLVRVFEGPIAYAVALSPEGTRAFVASRRSGAKTDTLNVIDIDRGVVEAFDAGTNSMALALSPQGDQLYIADAASNLSPPGTDSLISIQMGTRLPAEWELTSGTVSPLCYPAPQHVVAQLGSFNPQSAQSPTTISQVVPITELCTYAFTFEAIASQQFAVAEVFWINDECGLLRTDTVPVEALRPPLETFSSQLSAAFQMRDLEEKPALVLHQRRLDAPAGATQAEVRFNAPYDVVMYVGSVSLAGTNEALENTDLRARTEGLPAGWEMLPAVAPGVSLSAAGGEIQLRNNGSAATELVQSVDVEGNRPFVLELQGSTEARAAARANPSLELRWFKADKSQAAATIVLNLSPDNFDSASARGTTPPDAMRAEVHLIVPPGTTQKVKNVSLQFMPVMNVPVTFVAQAPGELSLFDWRIAFEQAELKRPPLPKKGLCIATPPGRAPGRTHDEYHCHYCPHCGAEQPADEPTPTSSPAGRPASVERCSVCGTKSVRLGGQSTSGTQPLAAHLPSARSTAVAHAEHVKPAALNESAEASPAKPFVAVVGIGPVRSMKLSALGINSLELLAAATPEDIMKVPGITSQLAANFIKQANDLLAQDRNA